MSTLFYLDLYTELENRSFTVTLDDSYDTSGGLRDRRFIDKEIEPIYKPTYGAKAESRVTLKVIIDMLFKEVAFSLDSDEDLFEIIDLMDRYKKDINRIDLSKFDKFSEENLFLNRFDIAYSKLKELSIERKRLHVKHNPNKKKTIFDILKGE